MSEVSKERIEELQTIIKEDYGKEVSFEEASNIARDTVSYFDLLAKLDAEQGSKQKRKAKKV